MKKSLYAKPAILLLVSAYFIGCAKTKPTSTNPGKYSMTTGAPFNQEGGFEVASFNGQVIPPNMVFVPGGSVTVGEGKYRTNVSLPPYFLAATLVTNIAYNEYLFELQQESEEKYQAALPDDSVWRREFSYNDPYINNYRVHPAFRFYPVVGVSAKQAMAFCSWLTEKINKSLAEKAGIAYDPEDAESVQEGIRAGIFVAECRLPTEAQWECAVRGETIEPYDEQAAKKGEPAFTSTRHRIYPWEDGFSLRGKTGDWKGKFMGNFMIGPGNYGGIVGESQKYAPTTDVYAYPPNDYSIYDALGNLREWTCNVYRLTPASKMEKMSPIRRDGTLDPSSQYDPNHTLVSDEMLVVKGACWDDPAGVTIGRRLAMHQDSSSCRVGFRYVVTSMGDPTMSQPIE